MSLETDIKARAVAYSALHNVIAGRIFPDKAPPAPQGKAPCVIYRRISRSPAHAMGNTPRYEFRYQFDSYATSKAAAVALNDLVIAAFNFYRGGAIHACLTATGFGSDEEQQAQNAQLFRESQDFLITA